MWSVFLNIVSAPIIYLLKGLIAWRKADEDVTNHLLIYVSIGNLLEILTGLTVLIDIVCYTLTVIESKSGNLLESIFLGTSVANLIGVYDVLVCLD